MDEFPLESTSNGDNKMKSFIIPRPKKNFLDFPNEIIHEILKFIPYEQIAKMRVVCRRFNKICSDILNSEFNSLRSYTQQLFQTVKSQMPRRESARRKHTLAREYDIIETLNMRLTLLQMTFSKHIKRKHCCFFPGEIIDEVHRILHYVKHTSVVNRAYKVTDELFDLSTMAIEYFKEFIEPTLPDVNYLILDYEPYPNLPSTSLSSLNSCVIENRSKMKPMFDLSSSSNKKSIANITEGSKIFKFNDDKTHKKDFLSLESFMKSTTIRLKKLEKSNTKNNLMTQAMKTAIESYKRKFVEYQKQFRKHQTHLDELDKKFEAFNLKFNQTLEEINQVKEELVNKNKCLKAMVNDASTQTIASHKKSNDSPESDIHSTKRIKLSIHD